MIKASELRVGNFALKKKWDGSKYDYEQCLIIGYAEGRVRVKSDNRNIYNLPLNSISPIELTEDWLVRLGFDNTNCIYLGIEDSSKYLQIIRGTYDCLILASDNSISSVLKPVKYVHQLQNLYFALTGQEITVK